MGREIADYLAGVVFDHKAEGVAVWLRVDSRSAHSRATAVIAGTGGVEATRLVVVLVPGVIDLPIGRLEGP